MKQRQNCCPTRENMQDKQSRFFCKKFVCYEFRKETAAEHMKQKQNCCSMRADFSRDYHEKELKIYSTGLSPSKEYHSIICNDPGMANTQTKALEIHPESSDEKKEDNGRLDRVVNQLYHRQLYNHRDQLQMIQEIRIIHPYKFKYSNGGIRNTHVVINNINPTESVKCFFSRSAAAKSYGFLMDVNVFLG